jgi:O-antigen ligase
VGESFKTLSAELTGRPAQSLLFLLVTGLCIALLATPYYPYALLPGFVILVLLFLGRAPQFGYYLIIFLIPFWSFRGLSETYRFLKLHWLLAFWLLILLAFQLILRKREATELRSNLWPWFLMLLTISFISALLSKYQEAAFTNLFLLAVAGLFLALNLAFISREGFSVILPAVLILSVSASSLLGVLGYVFDLRFFVQSTATEVMRSIGGALEPNNLSLMIIFTLPLLVNWIAGTRKRRVRIALAFLFCLDIAGIVVTYSRGGAVILLITLLLLFVSYMKQFRPRSLGFIMILIPLAIGLSILLTPSAYWERQRSIVRAESDFAIERRISYLYAGWEAFLKDPLLGTGPGTFKEVYATTKYAQHFSKEEKDFKRYAHNTYLEHLVGTGILGLVVFLVIVFLALRNFLRAHRNFLSRGDPDTGSWARAYTISFLSLLVYLFIFSDIYHKYLLLSLGLSQVALSLSLAGDSRSKDDVVAAP